VEDSKFIGPERSRRKTWDKSLVTKAEMGKGSWRCKQ